MKIVVVTGGIGSGKSTVLAAMEKLANEDVEFFSFDEFTRELYKLPTVRQYFINMFNTVDRKTISNIVFSSPSVKQVNDDYFMRHFEKKFVEIANQALSANTSLIIECPVFYEMLNRSDAMQQLRSKISVVVVTCDQATRVKRVTNRDNVTPEKVQQIMNSQKATYTVSINDQPRKYIALADADVIVDTSANNTVDVATAAFQTYFPELM